MISNLAPFLSAYVVIWSSGVYRIYHVTSVVPFKMASSSANIAKRNSSSSLDISPENESSEVRNIVSNILKQILHVMQLSYA